MQERREEKKYVGKFLEHDYDKFQNNFLSLLKDYKRKTQRLDKIIKQSDKQQFQFLKMNEELEEYKQKLEKRIVQDKILFQQSRQAQMGEMVSMIAHQWRQPLASISGTIVGMQLNQISDKYNLNDKKDLKEFLRVQDEKLTRMNHQVKLLSNTIDDFRDFFKPSKQKEKVVISSPINKALSMILTNLKEKEIIVNISLEIDTIVEIHQNEIVQVILNIIQNSEDNFIQKSILNPIINISTQNDKNNNPSILIEDNGGGISSDILSKIFDPYFSTKDEKNGTGIGLYMSKLIVEEHNDGKLSVYNNKNGASFNIQLK